MNYKKMNKLNEIKNFLDPLDRSDIDSVIAYLIEEGHMPDPGEDTFECIGASDYTNALFILSDKWHRLSYEEEQAILKIANRF